MRRKDPPAPVDDMPEELRRHPHTAEQIAVWVAPDEQMPNWWDLGGDVWWRKITAHMRWSRARRRWREQFDPSYASFRGSDSAA